MKTMHQDRDFNLSDSNQKGLATEEIVKKSKTHKTKAKYSDFEKENKNTQNIYEFDDQIRKAILLSVQEDKENLESDAWRYEPEDFVGLKNIQNTKVSSGCYFNSVIQALFGIDDFVKPILNFVFTWDSDEVLKFHKSSDSTEKKRKKKSIELVLALQKLLVYMQHGNKNVLSPSEVIDCIVDSQGEPINRGEELDIGEFLTNFIERIEEGLSFNRYKALRENRKPDKEIINDFKNVFFGVIKEYISFQGERSEMAKSKEEILGPLNLSIGEKELMKSLEAYLEYEIEKNDNMGNVVKGKKISRIIEAPKVLTLILKRVGFEPNKGAVKLDDPFMFPKKIHIKQYPKDGCEPNDKKRIQRIQIIEYLLCSIVIHEGDIESGHYYTLAYDDKQGKWMKFNDSIVTEITEEAVFDLARCHEKSGKPEAQKEKEGGNHNRPCAYCLFYLQQSCEVVDIEIEEIKVAANCQTKKQMSPKNSKRDSEYAEISIMSQPSSGRHISSGSLQESTPYVEFSQIILETLEKIKDLQNNQGLSCDETIKGFARILEILVHIFELNINDRWKEALSLVLLINMEESFFNLHKRNQMKTVKAVFLRACSKISILLNKGDKKEALEILNALEYCLTNKKTIYLESIHYLEITEELRKLLSTVKAKDEANKIRNSIRNIETRTEICFSSDINCDKNFEFIAKLKKIENKDFNDLEKEIKTYTEQNCTYKEWVAQGEKKNDIKKNKSNQWFTMCLTLPLTILCITFICCRWLFKRVFEKIRARNTFSLRELCSKYIKKIFQFNEDIKRK